jgi:hypothetical protein
VTDDPHIRFWYRDDGTWAWRDYRTADPRWRAALTNLRASQVPVRLQYINAPATAGDN